MKKPFATRHHGKPKTWLTTALLAAIALAYLALIFLPAQRSIGQLRSQVQERHQQILQAQSMTQTVALARRRLEESREVGQQWREQAPSPVEMATHIASLTQQAQSASVAIDRLDPLPAIDLNLIAQQGVTLQFHAPFASTFDLLGRLEAMPETIWLRNFRLQAAGETGNMTRGELTLTIFANRND